MAAKKSESSAELPATTPSTAPSAEASAAGAASFEQTLARLEALVTQLESGDLPLDSALRTFEDGVRLTRECQSALAGAQQKVQLLLQRGDGVVIEEFVASANIELSAPHE